MYDFEERRRENAFYDKVCRAHRSPQGRSRSTRVHRLLAPAGLRRETLAREIAGALLFCALLVAGELLVAGIVQSVLAELSLLRP